LLIRLHKEPVSAAGRLGVVTCRTVAIAAMALRRANESLCLYMVPDTVVIYEVPHKRTKSPHGKFALHSIHIRGYGVAGC